MKEIQDEDIYDDLDSLFPSQNVSLVDNVQEDLLNVSNCTGIRENGSEDENNSLYSAKSLHNNLILNEDHLKETEMNLFLDLLGSEMKNKSSVHTDPEFITIQKDLVKLQNVIAEKDIHIANLTNENSTLKKNICSLYKTAKAEIDQKDKLLQDCNKEIDVLQTRLREVSKPFNYKSSSISSVPNRINKNSMQNEILYKNDSPDYRDRVQRSFETFEGETTLMPTPSTSYKRSSSDWNAGSSKKKNPVYVLEKQKISYTGSHNILSKSGSDNELDKRDDFNNSQAKYFEYANITELMKQSFSCSSTRNSSDCKPSKDYKYDTRENFNKRQRAASNHENKIKFKKKRCDHQLKQDFSSSSQSISGSKCVKDNRTDK
ncbi:hypothetical protein NPIL_140851 [Nephila pilipes]|uniref:Uncharacterized protein n=1 Tax=Nephila pilipes TaxID=299642 RepID=A0A8X6MZP7_NEPPI|nr:hypothetical protein NPIL_140851 [Nephila pilipes]